MSKGFLVLAQNTKDVNYVKQAYALALSIRHSQKHVTNISIVTNNKVSKKYRTAFDQVIAIPWVEESTTSQYAAEHRWKLFHVTPYEETIVLDTDMLMLEDVSSWWDYCSNFDVKFCNRVVNYKLETITDTFYRKTFIANKLTNPYFALHYFKKTTAALEFYKTLEFVCNNWQWCYDLFAKDNWQDWLSMDLAAAIAIEVTGNHQYSIDQASPLSFVHMKPMIQSWEIPSFNWQDTVPLVFTPAGSLVVGNIKQPALFHYVEKDFMSTRLITQLEAL